MAPIDISDDVKKFVIQQIESVGQLEILLLLAQTHTREWTSRAVSQELRSNDAFVESHLNEFVARGLLMAEDAAGERRFRFDPERAAQAAVIQQLSSEYLTFRLRIIELIYSKPTERMQRLADAFRIRKDDTRG